MNQVEKDDVRECFRVVKATLMLARKSMTPAELETLTQAAGWTICVVWDRYHIDLESLSVDLCQAIDFDAPGAWKEVMAFDLDMYLNDALGEE